MPYFGFEHSQAKDFLATTEKNNISFFKYQVAEFF